MVLGGEEPSTLQVWVLHYNHEILIINHKSDPEETFIWSPENRGAVDNGFGRGKPIMIMVGAFTSQTLSYSLWSFRFHELSIGNLLEGTQLWWLGHWLLKQFYIHFGVLELLIGNLLEGNPIIMVETLQCIDLPNTFGKNGKLFSLSDFMNYQKESQ